MELSEPKKKQIEWELDALRAKRAFMPKTFTLGNVRLSKLAADKSYLEMVLVHSQVLEHFIKHILYGYEVKRTILKTLEEADPYAHIKLGSNEEDTLGVLIGTLCSFTGRTPLIEKLYRFNNDLRKEVVHHIFDGSKEVEPLEEKIKEFFGSTDKKGIAFTEMMDGLFDARDKVDDQIKELSPHVTKELDIKAPTS